MSRKEALSPVVPARSGCAEESIDSGRDSRELPNMDAGARARIEALVSRLFLRRLLDEDASVRIEASSVRTLFAVAMW